MAKLNSEMQQSWNEHWKSKGHSPKGHDFINGKCQCGAVPEKSGVDFAEKTPEQIQSAWDGYTPYDWIYHGNLTEHLKENERCGLTSGQSQKSTTSQAGISPDSTDAVNAKNRGVEAALGKHDRMVDEFTKGSRVQFAGGGKRSDRKPPLSLCPIELVEAVADTRAEGDRKYDVGNWMKFEREGWVDCLSHAIQHLMDFDKDTVWEGGKEVENESPETHLGHAATNIAFILWALRRGKVTREDFQNIAKVLPAK